MKQSELKVDPEKVKAFVERNRQQLARDPEKGLKRSGLRSATGFGPMDAAAGREGMRSTELRRYGALPGAPVKRATDESLTMLKALRVGFSAKRAASGQVCGRCKVRDATSWHHWVQQEHLRVMMRGLARECGWSPETTRRKLLGWLRDERNLTPMCTGCHEAGEHSQSRRFRRGEMPSTAWLFAAEVDHKLSSAKRRPEAVWRLEEYPE